MPQKFNSVPLNDNFELSKKVRFSKTAIFCNLSISSKWYCLLILVLSLVFVTAGCKKETTVKTIRLTEVAHSIFYAPQYVAIEKGFFEKYGMKIELQTGQGADKSMTALISQSADIGLMGIEASIYVYNEGKEDHAVCFAQLTKKAGNFLVSREDETNFDWNHVKGKSIIGGRVGGIPQLVLEFVLKQNGIVPGVDVEIVNNIQYNSTAGAFAGGIGDYTVEFEPTASTIEKQNQGYVAASLGKSSGDLPYTVYMASKDYIAKNPDVIQNFTNAIYEGQLWVNSHTSEEIAKTIAPHFTEAEISDITNIVERYKSQDSWNSTPIFDEKGFQLFQDIMEDGGELSKRVDFSSLVDTKYAKEALNSVKK